MFVRDPNWPIRAHPPGVAEEWRLLAPLAERFQMAVLLLVLFPILLMFDTRAAAAAMGLAIVLLYRGHTAKAKRPVRE